jgi:hypothetical protein
MFQVFYRNATLYPIFIDKRPNFSEVCAWLEAHMNEKEIHDADISLVLYIYI